MRLLRDLMSQNPAELIWPIVVFTLTLAIGWVVRWLILKALRAWTARTDSRGGRTLTRVLSGPSLLWILLLAIHVAMQSSDLPASITADGAAVLFILGMASVTLMSMRLAGSLV